MSDTYMPDHMTEVELCPRWVRVKFGGKTIADSKRVLMLRETGKLPVYFFPQADVAMGQLSPANETDKMRFWNITVGDKEATRAAYGYQQNANGYEALDGHLTFKWGAMDHWFEEEEEIFVHARDPYKRIDTIPSSRHIVVALNGVTLADTRNAHLLFETSLPTRYYLPKEDVNMEHLIASDSISRCPYKGIASYWSVKAGDQTINDLVWYYPDPIPECPKIKDLLCFFNEKVDITVDGVLQERPKTPWS